MTMHNLSTMERPEIKTEEHEDVRSDGQPTPWDVAPKILDATTEFVVRGTEALDKANKGSRRLLTFVVVLGFVASWVSIAHRVDPNKLMEQYRQAPVCVPDQWSICVP